MDGNNIHPVFDRIIPREEKEKNMGQRAVALWFTGLSGSGKTTLASALEKKLFQSGFHTAILDGDNVRMGISNNLGFSEADRTENVRRAAEISKLFIANGIIAINCFVSPTREMRQLARQIIGNGDFIEIYVNTPAEICEQRDVKGLYLKARNGNIKDFTGIQEKYEAPLKAEIVVEAGKSDLNSCLAKLLEYLMPVINQKHKK